MKKGGTLSRRLQNEWGQFHLSQGKGNAMDLPTPEELAEVLFYGFYEGEKRILIPPMRSVRETAKVKCQRAIPKSSAQRLIFSRRRAYIPAVVQKKEKSVIGIASYACARL